ncbi:MAG: LuxR C-terminal-related transcriptional regulator [Porticoccaceae bacterium]|nr:LuxR C-terminal-related transcriptional regulator [Porticoccaceae bacterium]
MTARLDHDFTSFKKMSDGTYSFITVLELVCSLTWRLTVLIIRRFKYDAITSVNIWHFVDNSSGAQLPIQINTVVSDTLKNYTLSNALTDGTMCHYISSDECGIDQYVDEFIDQFKVSASVKMLTRREMHVLEVLTIFKNTELGADRLHVSNRTFNNHRYNIAKKTGVSAKDAAYLAYDCSNVNLFVSMLRLFQCPRS